MAEGFVSTRCEHCRYEWPDPAAAATEAPGTPCPRCGATTGRLIDISLTDERVVREFLKLEGKEPGRKKPYIEVRQGDEVQVVTGRHMNRLRRIDRRADWYDEVVVDRETGQVVHECHEPLTEHWGHSSSKQPKPAPDERAEPDE
jgi:hypothetical protein